MKIRIMLPMALLVVASSAISFDLDAQTQSDLPAGWEEPTELPPGAVRLEDIDRGVAETPGAPTTPPAAAATMPASPTPPPMPNQPLSPPPAPVMPASPAPVSSPVMAGSGDPMSGGDTRGLPVDMRFAPPEAGGMSPSAPALPPTQAAAEPTYSSPPPPPVATSTSGASGRHSDLPAGWDEEVALPEGAVKLEDINSPYSGMTDRGAVSTPQSMPPAASAPMAPAYQPPAPVPAQPAYEPSSPEPTMSDVKKNDYKAPSRWENK